MRIVETPRGPVELLEPSVELLRSLRSVLPFGICQFSVPENGARYGLVMQCDKTEVHCIKQQPVEIEYDGAANWCQIQHWMAVETMTQYIKEGFSGGYLASGYLRQRDNGLWESGVAHFVFPSPQGIESQEFPFQIAYDNVFGHGSTLMFSTFAKLYMKIFRASPITPPQYFGLDIRPRLHLQKLGMFFMVLGPHIICLRAEVREREDPAWAILAANGVKQVFHIPSIPMAIPSSDLPITKGMPADEL